jgi:hypothetical protein
MPAEHVEPGGRQNPSSSGSVTFGQGKGPTDWFTSTVRIDSTKMTASPSGLTV